jgi:hypothetical protein
VFVAFLSAIFSLLLPIGIWLDQVLLLLILFFGPSHNQEENFLVVGIFFIPSGPILVMNVKTEL